MLQNVRKCTIYLRNKLIIFTDRQEFLYFVYFFILLRILHFLFK